MSGSFNAIGSALYTVLAAGTALIAKLGGTAIYQSPAQQGKALPYVVFFPSGGGDDNTSPKRARSPVWTVKAVSSAGALNAGEIDDLVDDLLHGKALTVTGWGNWRTTRESDVAYEELVAGQVVWHRGGLYRIRLTK